MSRNQSLPRPARPRQSLRERLASHERPGAILSGPPITVRCPCGERRELRHREVWQCRCDRRWNTAQIDAGQYARLCRLQWRYRLLPVAIGLVTSLVALLFLLTDNSFSLIVLLPMALIGWGVLLRPIHRRRYQQAISKLPQWKLRPE